MHLHFSITVPCRIISDEPGDLYRALDNRDYLMIIRDIFCWFCIKYVVTFHLTVQRRGHNIWFQWEIRKIIPQLLSDTPSYLELCSFSYGQNTLAPILWPWSGVSLHSSMAAWICLLNQSSFRHLRAKSQEVLIYFNWSYWLFAPRWRFVTWSLYKMLCIIGSILFFKTDTHFSKR